MTAEQFDTIVTLLSELQAPLIVVAVCLFVITVIVCVCFFGFVTSVLKNREEEDQNTILEKIDSCIQKSFSEHDRHFYHDK